MAESKHFSWNHNGIQQKLSEFFIELRNDERKYSFEEKCKSEASASQKFISDL